MIMKKKKLFKDWGELKQIFYLVILEDSKMPQTSILSHTKLLTAQYTDIPLHFLSSSPNHMQLFLEVSFEQLI